MFDPGMDLRTDIRQIFLTALGNLEIGSVMRRKLHCEAGSLSVGTSSIPLRGFARVIVVAVGKAAMPMADHAAALLRPALAGHQELRGIAVGPTDSASRQPAFRYLAGAHPGPDARSLAAADAVLDLLHACTADSLVLFLISGGASAMLERPLDARMTSDDVAEFHRVLVHSGLPIATMNVLRKHFSAVKGGRLAVAAAAATKCTLIVSDVPSDQLHVVGSGPTLPDPSTVSDCRRILTEHRDLLPFSPKLLEFFADPGLPDTPKQDHPAFLNSAAEVLLSSDDLCAEAAKLAETAGFQVVVDNTCDEWPFDDAAGYLLDRISKLRAQHQRVCLLSAGEVSVSISGSPGIGGRNQQFVLECARRLAESGEKVTVLSAGSDGIDGNSPAAGAVADEQTVPRARQMHMDVNAALAAFDSYPLLHALGDTIVTGPTGNNVRDLRILLSCE